MKRWAIVLISITLSIVLGTNVYATDDVTIYQDSLPANKGRIVMNFYSTDSLERAAISSPIKGVQVEVYYRYNRVMHNIKDLDLFKYTNLSLTSDENGKIILSNLPYGLYQYKIVSVPDGFEYSDELVTLDLNLMSETINLDIYLLKDIKMAEGTTDKVEDDEVVEVPKDEVVNPEEDEEIEDETEDNKEEEEITEEKNEVNEVVPEDKEENTEEVIVSVPKDEEAIKKDFNNLANNLYMSIEPENEDLTEDRDIMQIVSEELTKKANEQKVAMIEEMRNIRITESIKIAVVDMDDTLYYLKSLSDSGERDIEKNKVCKKRLVERKVEKKYKVIKINTTARIRTTMQDKGVA